jgi:hypothetical protein
VASAARLFLGELWYSVDAGIPYFEDILGQLPPASLIRAYLERAALTVPGVVSAQCSLTQFEGRNLSGQILFIDEVGAQNNVNF